MTGYTTKFYTKDGKMICDMNFDFKKELTLREMLLGKKIELEGKISHFDNDIKKIQAGTHLWSFKSVLAYTMYPDNLERNTMKANLIYCFQMLLIVGTLFSIIGGLIYKLTERHT